MAFQDFDQISERRRLEKKQRLKQRIIIGVVVIVLLVSAAIAAFLIYLNKSQTDDVDEPLEEANINNGNNDQNKDNSSGLSSDGGNKDKKVTQNLKAIKTVCQSTDYKETCESRLEKSLSSKPSGIPEPNDFVKAAISAASDELDRAITQASTFMKVETASDNQKATFDVCKQVLGDAQNDFNHSRNGTVGTTTAPDLRSWLSAVMAYQQTCIDAITEDATRASIEQALKTTKELTSNSLAIVSSLHKESPSPSSAPAPATAPSRRLLSGNIDHDLPIWMTHDTRRLLKADAPSQKPNVTVAKDGSGDFPTISKALEKLPENYKGRYVIHIKGGIYEENVIITKKMVNITMYGDGSQKTIITGNKNFVDGVPTFLTATFAAIGEGFIARSIGFRNTAGPEKHQAVALRVQSDRSVFLNCRMEGYQDTLYVQTHRQFYRGCYIMGTIDFIFGDAAAVLQTCDIVIRKPMENQKNTVTAQGRIDKHETTGIVLQKCKISADSSLAPEKSKISSYLGRPWKEYSRTIVMESEISDVIQPEGWLPWDKDFALQTLYYAEYNNIGAGSRVKGRVKWPGYQANFKKEEAVRYTVSQFIQGESWLKGSDVPVRLGSYS
uniref:pectinesterase-like n=1 Tax=Erigeron canadensis TaxID=72917 RepID=UPI001CB9511D|nr:pectinesterase-like [Erigeron canadensis]